MAFLIFSIISFLEVVRHWYVIEKLDRSPNKLLSWVYRAAAGIGAAYFDPHGINIALPVFLIFDWYIHDYVLNLFRGVKPIWYLNCKGPIDVFQRNYPNMFVWFIWKTILLVGLIGAYFFN